MVKIQYSENNKGKHRLVIKGHAGQGALGQDLVCAGVSTLTTTLVLCLNQINIKGGMLKPPRIELNNGNALVEVTPKAKQKNEVRRAFMQTLIGYEWLQSAYPENVSFEI